MRYPFQPDLNHRTGNWAWPGAHPKKPQGSHVYRQPPESSHRRTPGTDRDDPRTYFNLVIPTSPGGEAADNGRYNPLAVSVSRRKGRLPQHSQLASTHTARHRQFTRPTRAQSRSGAATPVSASPAAMTAATARASTSRAPASLGSRGAARPPNGRAGACSLQASHAALTCSR